VIVPQVVNIFIFSGDQQSEKDKRIEALEEEIAKLKDEIGRKRLKRMGRRICIKDTAFKT
jgi:hypothetical protein